MNENPALLEIFFELYASVYKSADRDDDDDSIHLAESLVRARKPHQTRVCILGDDNLLFTVPKILLARMTEVLKMALGWAPALH